MSGSVPLLVMAVFLSAHVCLGLVKPTDLEQLLKPPSARIDTVPDEKLAGQRAIEIIKHFIELGELPPRSDKRRTIFRFGKRGTLFRFGKRWGGVFQYENMNKKRTGNIFRYGKRSNMFRYGKKSGSFFRYGKKRSGNIFRYGKRAPGNVFRYGKRPSPIAPIVDGNVGDKGNHYEMYSDYPLEELFDLLRPYRGDPHTPYRYGRQEEGVYSL